MKFLSSRGEMISEGKMQGILYVGKWIYYHNNSNKIMTQEVYDNDGKLQGKRFIYFEDGQIAEESNYIKGSLEGASNWYSKKGLVLKAFIYVNNELHGIAKYYDDKGLILVEGSYKRDKKAGVWKYYNNGILVKEKDFTYIPKYEKKQ